MSVFRSPWNAQGDVAQQRRTAMLARIAQLRALEQRAADASARSRATFEKRGQLLPRERIGLLVDAGAPWLPLCSLAGYRQDTPDAAKSVPGGGVIAGIGFVSGVRCMVVASDSGIEAGAIQPMGLDKILRVQEIALQNKLPFVHLVESAGANLMRYKVEGFVHGGALFRNLARLSAAGIPVITVQHGSGTAGGAYMPGLSDVVVLVRGRSRAFLAGPPLLMAATGEVATEEELGGAEMHATVSGLGEYLAEDDRHALGLAREVVARSNHQNNRGQIPINPGPLASDPDGRDELLGLMSDDLRQPVDMREVMARIVDGADLLEFKPLYGTATLCVQARIGGHAVGIVSNNGPIDVAGANKAAHFIQWSVPAGPPHHLPAEHHGLHGGQGQRAGRHDQARQQDDPGRDQRHRAADHHPVRRQLWRGQLRHVRAGLCAALPVQLAGCQDGGDGRRAGGARRSGHSLNRSAAKGWCLTRLRPKPSSTRSWRCSRHSPTPSPPPACCSTTA